MAQARNTQYTSRMTPKSPNILLKDVEIKGTISFEHDLISDGRIEGEILSSGALTIGASGFVQGDISAARVAIHGQVLGNVTAEQRVELKTDSELVGDLTSPKVMIDEGATFVGRANIAPSSTNGSARPNPPVPAEKK